MEELESGRGKHIGSSGSIHHRRKRTKTGMHSNKHRHKVNTHKRESDVHHHGRQGDHTHTYTTRRQGPEHMHGREHLHGHTKHNEKSLRDKEKEQDLLQYNNSRSICAAFMLGITAVLIPIVIVFLYRDQRGRSMEVFQREVKVRYEGLTML